MAEKSAGAILALTIEKIRDLVDTSTIIGEAIYAEGGTTIIPVSKVTYGFASLLQALSQYSLRIGSQIHYQDRYALCFATQCCFIRRFFPRFSAYIRSITASA